MPEVGKIADRIRKLLALAKSANVNEAASAAAAAQELMEQHKLSDTDVEDKADSGRVIDMTLEGEGFMASWRFELATAVARGFFCEAAGMRKARRRVIKIIGQASDIAAVVAVYEFVEKEIDRLSQDDDLIATSLSPTFDSFSDEDINAYFVPFEQKVDVRELRESFRRGAVFAVHEKLKAARRRFEQSSEKALMVVKTSKQEIEQHIKTFNVPTQHKEIDLSAVNREAFRQGYRVGQTIDVGRRDNQPKLKTKGESKQ